VFKFHEDLAKEVKNLVQLIKNRVDKATEKALIVRGPTSPRYVRKCQLRVSISLISTRTRDGSENDTEELLSRVDRELQPLQNILKGMLKEEEYSRLKIILSPSKKAGLQKIYAYISLPGSLDVEEIADALHKKCKELEQFLGIKEKTYMIAKLDKRTR